MSAFDDSNYVLRLRRGFLGLVFGRRLLEYEIQAVPPRSSQRASFSWATGTIRREPSGPDLVRVEPGERQGLFARAYNVSNGAGAAIGVLVPDGPDWQIVDPLNQPLARASETHARFGQTRHAVVAKEIEVGRLTWTAGGTAAGNEVEVEFLPAIDQHLDRALLMALAPVLEDRARNARRGKG
jgi:hypothetical protein